MKNPRAGLGKLTRIRDRGQSVDELVVLSFADRGLDDIPRTFAVRRVPNAQFRGGEYYSGR